MNDNIHSPDTSLVRSTGQSLTTVRSDLIKRGLSLITRNVKTVLLVDDDQEMLLALKDGLEKYNGSFSIILADGGQSAIEKLKTNPISLVVTDDSMPKVDGFAVLSFIMEHYPEIPVIIMSAWGNSILKKRALEGRVIDWIDKPFLIDDFAKKIITTLRKESEGGTLHGVSSGMFLQLIEVEQKSCTIRLLDKDSGQNGVLFFKDGVLMDARTNNLQGKDAALDIFSWDNVTLSIQNDCPIQEKKIQGELQAILHDVIRIRDENKQKKKDTEVIKQTAKPTLKPDDADAHYNLGSAYSNEGTITNIDGNEYQTVKIGNQVWTVEKMIGKWLAKRKIKKHLLGCNFEMVKVLLTKKFSGSVIPNELASLLHAFCAKPEFDTASKLVLFDPNFLFVFELCRSGEVTEKLFRDGDMQ